MRTEVGERTLAQRLALAFGALFLAVGILGFVPWITASYDELKFAGAESEAELFGLFRVSVLHNVAHLLFGIGIVAARRHREALQYLLTAAAVYAVLVVYGLIASEGGSENFLPTNTPDDVLHAALAVSLFTAWAVARGEVQRDPSTTGTGPA